MSRAFQYSDYPRGRLTIESVSAIARRNLALMALLAASSAAVMAAFTATLADVYKASAVIEAGARTSTSAGEDLDTRPPTVDDEIAAILSRGIALKVIEKLDLRNDAEFRDNTLVRPDSGDAIARLIGGADATTASRQPPQNDPVAEKFAGALTVQRVRSARLIEIAFASASPTTAARVANAVADVYLDTTRETEAGFAKHAIEEKIASLRIKVADAERRAEKLSREALDSAKEELHGVRKAVAAERQLLESLLRRRGKAADLTSLPSPRTRIIQQAAIPTGAAGPNRLGLIVLAFAGGLLAGFALALARDRANTRTIRADDVAKAVGLVHLSSVPEVAVATGDPAAALKALRMIMAEPSGIFTEAIAGARFEIDMRSPTGVPRMIVVASSLPSEGAETIASNLAHQYAAIGRKVLLVDGDLRQAALTRRLAPSAPRGLLDVLARDIDFETAVLHDAASGLNFLPAMHESPAETCDPEMLASARMAAVFAFMKRKFDTVIVSAPALLPLPDARMLAEHADQIVLVMGWLRTPTETARRALRCLGHSRRKVVGVIMNDVDADGAIQTIKAGKQFGMHVPRRAA